MFSAAVVAAKLYVPHSSKPAGLHDVRNRTAAERSTEFTDQGIGKYIFVFTAPRREHVFNPYNSHGRFTPVYLVFMQHCSQVMRIFLPD